MCSSAEIFFSFVGKLISSKDLQAFLTAWLVDHIMRTDQALGAFIVAKRAAG